MAWDIEPAPKGGPAGFRRNEQVDSSDSTRGQVLAIEERRDEGDVGRSGGESVDILPLPTGQTTEASSDGPPVVERYPNSHVDDGCPPVDANCPDGRASTGEG